MAGPKSTYKLCGIEDLSAEIRGSEQAIGGSKSNYFNYWLLGHVFHCLKFSQSDSEELAITMRTAIAALIGICPRDEIEGIIAAQIVATHDLTMRCFQRATEEDQTFEGWRECLNQANKLMRSCAALVDALNRHRGKGQ